MYRIISRCMIGNRALALARFGVKHQSNVAGFNSSVFRKFSTSKLLRSEKDDKDDKDDIVVDKEEEQKTDAMKGEAEVEKEKSPVSSRRRRNAAALTDTDGAKEAEIVDSSSPAVRTGSIITPEQVEVVPLYQRPMFPATSSQIVIHDQGYLNAMIAHAQLRGSLLGFFLVKDEFRNMETSPNITQMSQIEEIGVLGRVTNVFAHPKMGGVVVLKAIRRIKALEPIEGTQRLTVKIEEVKDFEPDSPNSNVIQAYKMELVNSLKELSKVEHVYKDPISTFLDQADLNDVSSFTDVAAFMVTSSVSSLQDILATSNVTERLQKVLNLVKTECDTIKLQRKIATSIDEKLAESQRKFYLNEQLKQIKKELGLEVDEKEVLVKKWREAMETKKPPENVLKVFEDSVSRFQSLEPVSMEYGVTRYHLDWLTSLPWGIYKEESLNVTKAAKVLDEDHYGLKDIKEAILEFIAVGAMKGTLRGKILCFVGPPGVGKTSIGKSIARALDREFFRFSVGGLHDVSEIKGHRRTYVGSMPGKLIQCLKEAKSSNPVIMIDEIDKLATGRFQGDPASALLEVLDPEQNAAFLDHFIDVPFDLSKVLFLCTANVLEDITPPLRDRMEILRLSGYVADEKMAIATKYIIPKKMEETGLKKNQVKLDEGAVMKLITAYCREAGVRNLQRYIEKVYRKVALKLAKKEAKKVAVDEDNLKDFVGAPLFTSDRYYPRTPPGVTVGLAWNSLGGCLTYIETTAVRGAEGTPSLKITGKMGEVMKESAEIAYTYARYYLSTIQPNNSFFKEKSIHMHCPEGATPKDGPSAGVTMVTSLLSLALGKNVRHDLAMTGELTLTGKVLEIGGVKEKSMAAQRAGIKHIIFPKGNEKDWLELPDTIKKGLEPRFVDYYSEVFDAAFNYDVSEEEQAVQQLEEEKEKHALDDVPSSPPVPPYGTDIVIT